MASVKDTVRQSLFNFPTIYPNPVRVLEHLFCSIGNDYAWKNGELVCATREPLATEMDFEDLMPGYVSPIVERMWRDHPEMAKRTRTETPDAALRRAAKLTQRQFIAENMEAILDAPLTNTYFGNPWEASGYMKGSADAKHSPGLNFPNDIKQDWAETLELFLRYWRQCLGQHFGAGIGLGDTSGWPKQAQQLMIAIENAQARIHPLVHGGENLAGSPSCGNATVDTATGHAAKPRP